VTILWVGQQRNGVWISRRGKSSFSSTSVPSVQSTHSVIQGAVGLILLESKRPGRESDQISSHSAFLFFFLRFIAQNISEIHRVTKLRNCSFNQLALVVPRRASDREYTVLGSYEYSSEKQVQRKNTAAYTGCFTTLGHNCRR